MASGPARDPVMAQLLMPRNTALLVIDYQPSQVQTVTSIDREVLVDNIISVARLAETFDLPVVLSTINISNGQKPTIPELKAVLAHSAEIDRTSINSWDDVEFRRAAASSDIFTESGNMGGPTSYPHLRSRSVATQPNGRRRAVRGQTMNIADAPLQRARRR